MKMKKSPWRCRAMLNNPITGAKYNNIASTRVTQAISAEDPIASFDFSGK